MSYIILLLLRTEAEAEEDTEEDTEEEAEEEAVHLLQLSSIHQVLLA